MPILGVIASGITGNLPTFITNFTQEGSLPLTNTFNAIANGFTEGKVYWGGGRAADTNSFYSFYSRTTTSSTWTYENAKPNQGQARSTAYPVGSTDKWIQNGGEYGGALNDVQSMVYGGSWVTETNYPITVSYNGFAAIRNTKIGYSFAGTNGGNITTAYSYTGSGSWTAQTAYPTAVRALQYQSVGLPTKVVGCGGFDGSAQISLVYSYTGSGSWVAETSLPASLNTTDATFVYNPTTAKVYGMCNANTNFYYWTGSGAWVLGGTRSAMTTGQVQKALAAVSTSLFALGGDYNTGAASSLRAVVR